MVKRKVVIVGDSHAYAIQKAIAAQKAADPEFVFEFEFEFEAYRFKRPKRGKGFGDLTARQILRLIKKLTPRDVVVSTIGGNHHSAFGLIQHPVAFDVLLPGREEAVAEGAQIIPSRAVSDYFVERLERGDIELVSQLASAAPCPVYHLAPPPPKRDDDFIRSNHETQFAARGLTDNGVSPAPLRYKLWKLQTDLTQRIYEKAGVKQLMPPQKALDEDGYLRPDFYAKDATHANKKYGTLVLRQIKSSILASETKPEQLSAASLQNAAG